MSETHNNQSSMVGERIAADQQKVIEELKKTPIVQVACQRTGIGRATYYRWKTEDSAFAKECDAALREGIELINDMSESQIVQLIKERKLPAITLWLRSNNPRYGGKAAPRSPVFAAGDLSPEEEKLFKKALALSAETPKKHKHGKRNILKKSA